MSNYYKEVPVSENPSEPGEYFIVLKSAPHKHYPRVDYFNGVDWDLNETDAIDYWLSPVTPLKPLSDEDIAIHCKELMSDWPYNELYDEAVIDVAKKGAVFTRDHYALLIDQQGERIKELEMLLQAEFNRDSSKPF